MSETVVTKKPETNELVFERVFAAPREKVFAAFKDASALSAWWGPDGWETTSKEMNFSTGGKWHYGMKCVDKNQGEWFGKTSWGLAVYETVDEPNGFSYTDYFSNEAGQIDKTRPATSTTIELIEVDGGTKLVSTTRCATREDYESLVVMGIIEGATQTWDRLEAYVT